MKYALILLSLIAVVAYSSENSDALFKNVDRNMWNIEEDGTFIKFKYRKQVYIYNSISLPTRIQAINEPDIDVNHEAVVNQKCQLQNIEVLLIKTNLSEEAMKIISESILRVKPMENTKTEYSSTISGLYLLDDIPNKAIDGKYYYVVTPIMNYLEIYPDRDNSNFNQLLKAIAVIK
jgi:hypothetical protein